MNLAIFGATGATGRHLVDQALAVGHRVTILARNPAALAVRHERLRIVQGDARDPDRVAAVIAGQDAVLSALGGSGRGPVTVCGDAMASILAAMGRHGVRRLVALSAYGAADSHDNGVYNRLLWLIQKEKMLDKERMEEMIGRSAVDWTIVRPPTLANSPRTGRYHVGTDLRMTVASRIARADVADFMLGTMAEERYIGKTPAITSGTAKGARP
ncbi:MAG: SDR family oxidoreductase [Chloroflexota bacterium]|nr:SDR family oxidoreductase [Chloroflexota bacterium]